MKNVKTVIRTVFLVLLIAVVIVPFLWMVTTSLKTLQEAIAFPPSLLPEQPMFSNYIKVWNAIPFALYLKNSLIVTIGTLIIQYIILIPAAYGFARYKFFGKNVMFAIVLLAFMLPQQITFIPVYIMFAKIHLVDSYLALIAPFAANAFGIFLLRQYFMQFPEEIIEAARLDDASIFKIIARIMIPMAKPVLVTIGLLSFISCWNGYFWPLVMTTTDKIRTLPIGITTLRASEGTTEWNIVMAGNVLLTAPVLLLYFFANKQIKKAFVYSGIK